MAKKTDPQEDPTQKMSQAAEAAQSDLARALVQAIELTRPEVKKNAFNRKVGTPWTPKDGSPKLKLKRPIYQHGLPLEVDLLSNREIDLCNKVKPGSYLAGIVKVNRRRDRALDISYPVKTASQRLKLVNQFGVRSFSELLEQCIAEGERPKVEDTDID